MIWPFSRWIGKSRDRRQICESLTRIVDRDHEQRQSAKAENSAAANSAIMAVEHRMNKSSSLRDVLAGVVERQREDPNSSPDRGR